MTTVKHPIRSETTVGVSAMYMAMKPPFAALVNKPGGRARQMRLAVLHHPKGNDTGPLALRAATGRASAPFPAEIGVVELDAAAELALGFGQHRDLQQLVRGE